MEYGSHVNDRRCINRNMSGYSNPVMRGAGDWNRTSDLRFTKPLLYQLSYAGLRA